MRGVGMGVSTSSVSSSDLVRGPSDRQAPLYSLQIARGAACDLIPLEFAEPWVLGTSPRMTLQVASLHRHTPRGLLQLDVGGFDDVGVAGDVVGEVLGHVGR